MYYELYLFNFNNKHITKYTKYERKTITKSYLQNIYNTILSGYYELN